MLVEDEPIDCSLEAYTFLVTRKLVLQMKLLISLKLNKSIMQNMPKYAC